MRGLVLLASVGGALATGERPLAKVISLLKNMAKELEQQKKDDDKVFKKFQCWCEKNEKEKSAEFETAKDSVVSETAAKEKADAEIQAKGVEFEAKNHERELKTAALAEFEAKCGSDSTKWTEESAKTHTEINQLKGAIAVLKKHNFLQSNAKTLSTDVKNVLFKLADGELGQRLGENSPSQLASLLSFVRPDEMMGTDSATSFLQVPGVQSYANQSGQIYGILEQMLEDMERDFELSKKTRADTEESCSNGRDNLNKEQTILTETIQAIDARRAELGEQSAAAQENLNAARETRDNASAFLADLNEKCTKSKNDYDSRTAGRAEELKAIYDTIPILNDDAAFAAMGRVKTTKSQEFNAGGTNFIQVKSEVQSLNVEIRDEAYNILNKLQNKHAGTALVQYLLKAAAPDKGALAKVIDKIDLLHEELQTKIGQERVDFQDCVDEANEIKAGLTTKDLEKTNAQNNIDQANAKIAEETAVIKELEEAAAELNAQMAEEGANREEEGKQYQKEYEDTKVVIGILDKAIARLAQTYTQKFDAEADAFVQQEPGALHVEVGATATDAGSGPAAFANGGKTEQSAGGNKAVALLKTIQADS